MNAPKPDLDYAERMGWIKRPEPTPVKPPRIRIRPLSNERRSERERRRLKVLINKRLRLERKGMDTSDLPQRTRQAYRIRCRCCMELFERKSLIGGLCLECHNDPERVPSVYGSR